jgi:hypothetical protein
MYLTEAQKQLIMRQGGNARDVEATENDEVTWDWELLAS